MPKVFINFALSKLEKNAYCLKAHCLMHRCCMGINIGQEWTPWGTEKRAGWAGHSEEEAGTEGLPWPQDSPSAQGQTLTSGKAFPGVPSLQPNATIIVCTELSVFCASCRCPLVSPETRGWVTVTPDPVQPCCHHVSIHVTVWKVLNPHVLLTHAEPWGLASAAAKKTPAWPWLKQVVISTIPPRLLFLTGTVASWPPKSWHQICL